MCPFWPAEGAKKPQQPPKQNKHHHPQIKPYFLFSGIPGQLAVSFRGGRAVILPHALGFQRGAAFPKKGLSFLLVCLKNGKEYARKGFWLVHLNALPGLKGGVVVSSTALSDVRAILHCRSGVDELAEYVIDCAWALKLFP